MVELVRTRAESINSGGNQDNSVYDRSYVAMVLSAILPGLGQLYLAQFVKGVVIFLIFASALALFYLNSLPVKEWSDLMRFKPVAKGDTNADSTGTDETQQPYEFHLWTFDDGERLMFRPSWKFKISSSVQAVLCWLYAVGDGWRGRRRTGRH
jgi:hypothetical protein